MTIKTTILLINTEPSTGHFRQSNIVFRTKNIKKITKIQYGVSNEQTIPPKRTLEPMQPTKNYDSATNFNDSFNSTTGWSQNLIRDRPGKERTDKTGQVWQSIYQCFIAV